MFYDSGVNVYCFGRSSLETEASEAQEELDIFPDMKTLKKIKYGQGSGLLILAAPRE